MLVELTLKVSQFVADDDLAFFNLVYLVGHFIHCLTQSATIGAELHNDCIQLVGDAMLLHLEGVLALFDVSPNTCSTSDDSEQETGKGGKVGDVRTYLHGTTFQ